MTHLLQTWGLSGRVPNGIHTPHASDVASKVSTSTSSLMNMEQLVAALVDSQARERALMREMESLKIDLAHSKRREAALSMRDEVPPGGGPPPCVPIIGLMIMAYLFANLIQHIVARL